MIMDRKEEIRNAALNHQKEFNTSNDDSVTGAFGNGMHKQSVDSFKTGAEWADAHPKEIEGCDFCKQERVATHRSKECDLSYDGETICVDIDIPLTWGSATGYYGFDINYCPMCGTKLKGE